MNEKLERHRFYEDVLAMLVGTMFVSLGMLIFAKAKLVVGGVVGMALLVEHTTGLDFWGGFLLINLPFAFLALARMGWRFAARTFCAVVLVSLLSRLSAGWVDFSRLDPAYAAVTGGALCGMGLLILFRHQTGLGGVNVLAIYLQQYRGIRAGYFQLVVDLAILSAGFAVLNPHQAVLSVVGTVVVNMVIAINHKPGRYAGVT